MEEKHTLSDLKLHTSRDGKPQGHHFFILPFPDEQRTAGHLTGSTGMRVVLEGESNLGPSEVRLGW